MRDKQFIIDSIKMDLFRVITAAGDISKKLPEKSVIEFLQHAHKDFEKVSLTPKEKLLKQQLLDLEKRLPDTNDSPARLRWTEDVMTVRCRL